VEDTLTSHHSIIKAPFFQEISSHKLQPFLCTFQIPEMPYFLLIPYQVIEQVTALSVTVHLTRSNMKGRKLVPMINAIFIRIIRTR
jgi:hypothetical protein